MVFTVQSNQTSSIFSKIAESYAAQFENHCAERFHIFLVITIHICFSVKAMIEIYCGIVMEDCIPFHS